MENTQKKQSEKKKNNLQILLMVAAFLFGAVYLFFDADRTPDSIITLDGFEMKINSTKASDLKEAGFSVTGGPVIIGAKEFTSFSYKIKKDGKSFGAVGLANYTSGDKMSEECTIIRYYFNGYNSSDISPLLNGKDYKGLTFEQAVKELGEPEDKYDSSSQTKYQFGKKKKITELTFDKTRENQLSTMFVEYKVQ